MTKPNKPETIATFAAAAQAEHAKYGVPASIVIAQAILESGWGASELALQDNNFFGIKARAGEDYCEFPPDAIEKAKGDKARKRYAKFASVEACFERHGELLSTADRYQPAMAVAADPLQFAAQLQRCGYSQDPLYAKKLCRLILDYTLVKFDSRKESQ